MSLLLREWPAAKGLLADVQVVPQAALSAKIDRGSSLCLGMGTLERASSRSF